MGGELCAAGPAVEEGPKLPAGRLNKTAASWKRTPCPSGRGGKWRRTGKVDRWRELGDARRAAVCERGRGGQHFVVAWAGRHGRDINGVPHLTISKHNFDIVNHIIPEGGPMGSRIG